MTEMIRPGALRAWDAAALWQWWCVSMADWLPQRWRARWRQQPDELLLQAVDGRLHLAARLSGNTGVVRELPLPAGEADLQRVLDPATLALPRRWLLDPSQVLRRTQRLPAAVAARLDAVLGFEIDRQTPFQADQVVHATRVLGRHGADQIDAELIVLPQARLKSCLEQAGQLAGSLSAVDVGGIDQGTLGINLLPPSQRARRRSRHGVLVAGLVAVGLVLTVLAAGKVLDNRQQAVVTLQQQVRGQSVQAREVAAQRQQIQTMVDAAVFFQQRGRQRPDRLAILEELTARLPDGTWVERLSIEGDQLQVTGLSDQASALVSALEGSALWERPSLTGVLQAEPGQRSERFTLSATVRVQPSLDARNGGVHADAAP